MKKKKKNRRVYFGKEVQDAIIRYNELKEEGVNLKEREQLFSSIIYPAFMKMAENVINKWKIRNFETNFQDMQSDLVSFMYTKMPGYDPEKGRAYSYFTVICRNYSFQMSNTVNKNKINKTDLLVVDYERDVQLEKSVTDYQEALIHFLPSWCDLYLEYAKYLHKSKRDYKIAIATIEILKSHKEIDVYNKKILYVLIREYANVQTQHITSVIKKIKVVFTELFQEYITYNKIDFEGYLKEKGYYE